MFLNTQFRTVLLPMSCHSKNKKHVAMELPPIIRWELILREMQYTVLILNSQVIIILLGTIWVIDNRFSNKNMSLLKKVLNYLFRKHIKIHKWFNWWHIKPKIIARFRINKIQSIEKNYLALRHKNNGEESIFE